MKKSIITGASFGLVSGVLTTLGLLIGLEVSTQSKLAVISGIITIAIADALSDAFGMHLSQESSETNSAKSVWVATVSTFLSKFMFALTFLIPILFLDMNLAIPVSILWGLLLIFYLSYLISKRKGNGGKEFIGVITEHLLLFVLVIISSYLVGRLLSNTFQIRF